MARRTRKVNETELTRGLINWLVDTRPGYRDAAVRLPKTRRVRDRGAWFPSMQDIYLHILHNSPR